MYSKFLVAALFTAVTGAAHATTIVENGDFETSFSGGGIRNGGQTFDQLNVSGPSWNIWNSIPGWTTTSGAGIEIQSDRTLNTINAHSGNHYIELDSNNNTSMTQQVYLDIGEYDLSFYYSPRTGDAGTNGVEFSIAGLLAAETITGPDVQTGTAVGQWTEVSRTFDVTSAGLYDLTFGAVGTSNSLGGFIDTVSIQTTTPVPLPAGFVLLGSAAVGMTMLRKRNVA